MSRVENVDIFVAYLRRHALGRRHAKRAKTIGEALGFRDRELRALACEATEGGVLVCADNAGYYLPADVDEAVATIGRLRSQAFEMLRRAKTLEAQAKRKFGRVPRMTRPTSNQLDLLEEKTA